MTSPPAHDPQPLARASQKRMQVARFIRLHLAYWGGMLMLPLLVLQARRVRKLVPRLQEATGPRASDNAGDSPPSQLRIAIVGESTAAGVGADTLDEALPGHLARALVRATGRPVGWSLLGGNGTTVERALASVHADTEGYYHAAVVLLGVNDVFRMTSIESWLTNVRLLVAALRNRYCRLIVFSAVPPLGHFPALPQPLRAVLGARAALLDHYLAQLVTTLPGVTHCAVTFPTELSYVAPDGIHPSALGYRDWAEQLAQPLAHVRDVLELGRPSTP